MCHRSWHRWHDAPFRRPPNRTPTVDAHLPPRLSADRLRTAAHDVGVVLAVPTGLALTGLAVALAAGEPAAALGFGGLAVGGGLLSGGLVVGLRGERQWGERVLLTRGAVARPVMAVAWLAASLLAAIPFLAAGAAEGATPATAVYGDPLNAWFESMSGLTSTGLTVTPDASRIPRSLQWWRSLLQWVGGIGILYVALGLAPDARDGSHGSELDTEMSTDYGGGESHVGRIWGLYVAYTVVSGMAFWAVGMPLWEAVNHSMTAIATGGFDVTGDSLASYGRAVHAVAAVTVVLGAISFKVHAAVLLRGRPGALLRDAQSRLLAAMLVVGVGVLALATRGDGVALADAAFQWTSALTTVGFSTEDVAPYGAVALGVLLAGMVVGGASGSTAGGLKQRRAVALLRRLAGRDAPRAARALRQLGRVAAALAVGAGVIVAASGAAPLDAMFEAASALGTVGLSVGVTAPDLAAPARLALIALMWLGRLEIAAVLALFMGCRRA